MSGAVEALELGGGRATHLAERFAEMAGADASRVEQQSSAPRRQFPVEYLAHPDYTLVLLLNFVMHDASSLMAQHESEIRQKVICNIRQGSFVEMSRARLGRAIRTMKASAFSARATAARRRAGMAVAGSKAKGEACTG
eukprot:6174247-Pleurochrysis_carterae.AAC.2